MRVTTKDIADHYGFTGKDRNSDAWRLLSILVKMLFARMAGKFQGPLGGRKTIVYELPTKIVLDFSDLEKRLSQEGIEYRDTDEPGVLEKVVKAES